jgi:hypothetical protein
MEFFNVLTGEELLDVTEAQLPEHRERLYPPTVTLSMFLRQALDPDPSCQRAIGPKLSTLARQQAYLELREVPNASGTHSVLRVRVRAAAPQPVVAAAVERPRSG